MIIALVFFVIFLIVSSIFIFHVSKSQSIKTGFKLFLITALAVEMIEKEGIKTSEFFFKFKDFTAISNAAVPFETATPNFFLL